MNDCCNGSSHQKECCKAAVEAYKQELLEKEKLGKEQKSKWFTRGLAVMLPIELAYLWRGEWNFIIVMFSMLGAMCWLAVLLDLRKWIKTKNTDKISSSEH